MQVIGLHYKHNFLSIQKCSTKVIRNILISKIKIKPISQLFWENKFKNKHFDWYNIWKARINIVKESLLKTINWKVIYLILIFNNYVFNNYVFNNYVFNNYVFNNYVFLYVVVFM